MSLNPTMTVGRQIAEVLERHGGLSRAQARASALRQLDLVCIPAAASRFDAYPLELSGGMCQRIMIASAVAGRPRLLMADEPTTALDVTVQAEILGLLKELQAEIGMGMLFVSHDMGVVAELADEAVVMRDGRVVEKASIRELFANPVHAYTRDLLSAVPRLGSMAGREGPRRFVTGATVPEPAGREGPRAIGDVVLSVRDLCVRYDLRAGAWRPGLAQNSSRRTCLLRASLRRDPRARR